MALTNAQKQARWRAKRNALAREAEAMRATRGRRTRRARPGDDANAFIRELRMFEDDYFRRLIAFYERTKVTDEQLLLALHSVANDFSILVQELCFPARDGSKQR